MKTTVMNVTTVCNIEPSFIWVHVAKKDILSDFIKDIIFQSSPIRYNKKNNNTILSP